MEYGKIAIFKNNNKATEKHPDFNGKITVTEDMKPGVYDVSIYNNTSKAGNKYLGGKIREEWKPKKQEEVQMSQGDSQAIDNAVEGLDDEDQDIPF